MPTNSGHRRPPLIKHCNSLRHQQLGFWNNCQDTQDVKGVPHCVTPTETSEPIIGDLHQAAIL